MKIAIVGGAPSTRGFAPFNDPEWEIWGLGNQIDYYFDKRIDRVFEIHDNLDEHGDIDSYWEFIKQVKAPFVVSPKYAKYGEAYPYEKVNALLGTELLTSSPAYMMAYALLSDVTDIGLYGVEMAIDDHEYFKQRPGIYAWIAFAKGKGVNVHIPPQSSLFKEGYCEGRDWGGKKYDGPFSMDQFSEMIEGHAEKINELTRQQDRHHGAMQAYQNMSKVYRAFQSGAKNIDLRKVLSIK